MTQIEAKKSLGQHWLKDQASLKFIVEEAELKPNDKVLEIGPGTGELTNLLIASGAQITALELDQNLIDRLKQNFSNRSIQIVEGDIRTFDLTSLPKNYKIVANIPYYLTANLLRILTDTTNKPSLAVLLVQKEVAERVVKKPGQMSFIGAAVQLNYEVSLGAIVKAEFFTPPPKVNSQVLILKKLREPRFTDVDYLQLIRFIKIGFAQPRKTLVNNLTNGLELSRSDVEEVLQKVNIKLQGRAQEISLEKWHELYRLMH